MNIQMTIQSESSLLPITLVKLLLQSFSYADIGTTDGLSISKRLGIDRAWESTYGTVAVTEGRGGKFHLVMSTMRGCSLIARSLGVFEHLLDKGRMEVQDVYISNVGIGPGMEFQDFSSKNLYKLSQQSLPDNPEEWWDHYVLPVIEKI